MIFQKIAKFLFIWIEFSKFGEAQNANGMPFTEAVLPMQEIKNSCFDFWVLAIEKFLKWI